MLAERLHRIAEIIPKWEKAESITLITLSFSDAGTRAEYLSHQPGKQSTLRRDDTRLQWLIEELREELRLFDRNDSLLIHQSRHRPVFLVDYRGHRGEMHQFEIPRPA